MKPIRLMIVDDSATVRQVLSAILDAQPDMEVIATAQDPLFAMEKMQKDWPDVIILDVEMPRMDGITFLRRLMSEHPTPVVICSTLTEKGAETTMQALAAGAIGFVTKPKLGLKQFLIDGSVDLVAQVRAAAQAKVRSPRVLQAPASQAQPLRAQPLQRLDLSPAALQAMAETTDKVVAVGASTGGTQALELFLSSLPRVSPGIVIVQHMPEKFTAAFAGRLNKVCALEVMEARHGDRVLPGRALIAPGGKHMTLKRSGAQYQVEVVDGPPINRHRPSVDVLFRSVARTAGSNALGIIMTGMGDDGARGLRLMHDAGATTLAQDEASCVVYGMPKEAVKLGGVDRSVALEALATEVGRFTDSITH
ncbi:MAG: chemotaxis response regulator protein-glutamate methylesterase [Gammaproteobacteria bacterium]|nr:chemotaxis response regulator protein-glutamate methylesterase [Gammaproteobacteria bacterium]